MEMVRVIDGHWCAASRWGVIERCGRRWTPLLLDEGYSQSAAETRAEELGLIATAGRPPGSRVQ